MIRTARQDDAGWITDIWNKVINDTTLTFTTQPKTVDDISQMIASAGPAFLVEHCQGFATYGLFRGGPGYQHVREHTIYLDEAAQGKGLGRTLLSALETVGREQGIDIFVGGISSSNPGAKAFHENMGYRQVADMPGLGRKWEKSLDLWFMQKNLRDTRDAGV